MSKWWESDKTHGDSWDDDPIAPAATVSNLQAAYRQNTGAAADIPTPFDNSLPQTAPDSGIGRQITQFSTAAGQTGEAGLRDLDFALDLVRAGAHRLTGGEADAAQFLDQSGQAQNLAESERLKNEAQQTSRPGAITGTLLSLAPTLAASEVAAPARIAAGAGRLAQVGEAIAGAAPAAGLMSAEQSAANAGQRLNQNADLGDVERLYGAELPLNFAANLLPVSAPGNVLTRAITGGAIGAASNTGVAAAEHAIAPSVAEAPTVDSAVQGGGVGAILAALLGHGAEAATPEARLTPDPVPEAAPPTLGLPADAAYNGEFRAGARPVQPESPGTVRVDSAGNAYTPQQGAQAVSDALSSIVTRPELPEPVVHVDPQGVATTSADQNAALQQDQAARQAVTDAAQNRRDLGITPDIERTQAPKWAEQDEVVPDGQAAVPEQAALPDEAAPTQPSVTDDPAFSFAGENARTADRVGLENAKNIEAFGRDQVPDRFGNQPGSPEDTHIQTGWHRGADDKWRFEIDDSDARLVPSNSWEQPATDKGVPLTDVLDHPSLIDAYPQLGDVQVKVDDSIKSRGGYDPTTNTITVRKSYRYPSEGADSLKSTLIHELQHVVQTEEGFARGGNSAEFVRPRVEERDRLTGRQAAIDKLLVDAPPGARRDQLLAERGKVSGQLREKGLADDRSIKTGAFKDYQRLSGEVEARNTQSRLDLTAEERRATPPSETADTPRDQQTVKFNSRPSERNNREADSRSTENLSKRLSGYIGKDVSLAPARSVPDAVSRALAEFDKAFGGRTVVFDNANPEALDFQGVTLRDGVRFVNSKTDAPLLGVAAHEMLHQMRADRPDLYEELEAEIRKQGKLDKYGENVRERARRGGEDPDSLTDAQIREELTADAVGDALTDPEFLEQLAKKNPGLFAKVADYIKDFLDRVVSRLKNLGSSDYLDDITTFRTKLEDVLEKYGYDRQDDRSVARSEAPEKTETDELPAFSRKQYTPEQKTFLEKAGLAEDERSTVQKVKESLAEVKDQAWDTLSDPITRAVAIQKATDNFTQSTTDRLHGLKVAERGKGFTPDTSAYVAARLATGSPAILGHVLEHGGIKWADAASATGDKSVPSLMDAIAPVKKDINEWLGWMVANRAEKLKKEGRENLMSDADIQAGKSLSAGKTPEFTEAAEDYDQLRTNILDFAENAGTINPDTRAMWDQAGHIPFYRLREDGDVAGPGTTRGLANQKKPIKQLKGGESALKDPLSNIVQNFASLIDGAVKNNAALLAIKNNPDMFTKAPPQQEPAFISLPQVKAILKERGVPESAIKALGPDALKGMQQVMQTVPPTGDDVIRVLEKGKPTYYRVSDPLMYRALTGMQDFERSLPVKALGLFKHLLTAGVTTTPTFAAANLLRDSGEAYLTSGVNMIPVAASVNGAIKAMRHDPVVQDLMASGSSFHGGLYQQGNNDATAKVIRRALKEKGKDDAFITKFLKTVTNPAKALHAYRALLEAGETGSRVAVFEGMKKKGASNAEAALAAKDLLDFSKRGDSQILALFTDTTPFLNARIQGLSRLARVAKGEDAAGNVNPKLRNMFLRRIASLTAISTLLYAWNQLYYKDGYDQLEEWDKDTYWHIAPGTKYHARIPKPFELGLVAGTLPERILGGIQHALGKGGDDAKTLGQSFWRALTGTLEVSPPQFFKPIIEEYANTNMFTGRPIETQADQKLLPQARSNWYTSDTAQAIGEATGTSPKRIEHLVNGYLGGLGTAGLKSADWMVRKATGAPERPEQAMRDFPVLGRFFRGDDAPANTKQLTKFYANTQQANQVAQTIKEYLVRADERHDPSFEQKAKDLAAENKDILGDAVVSRRAKAGIQFSRIQSDTKMQGFLTSVRDENEAISQDTKLTPDQKRQRINANIEQRNQLLLQYQRDPDQTVIPRSPKAATSIKIDPIRASMSSDD